MDSNVLVSESRRVPRVDLQIPVRVDVKAGRSVSWQEMARTSDISAFGAAIRLERGIRPGRVVQLTLEMPQHLRRYHMSLPDYRIWAIVSRSVQTTDSEGRHHFSTGLAFLGPYPPVRYSDQPGRLYRVAPPAAAKDGFWRAVESRGGREGFLDSDERRKESRFSIPEPITIELMGENGDIIAFEPTLTENISVGGARVCTDYDIDPGTFVRVVCPRQNVEIISVVKAARKGADGISRLHIQFVDRLFPLEGVV